MGRIRARLPHAAITSDFIVGFCGETDEDFQKTYDLVAECRFKNSFIFKYSERPGTKAAERYPDDVPEEVKKRRNQQLLMIQDAISEEQHRAFIGRTTQILVEGPSKNQIKQGEPEGPQLQLTGRTHCDRIVVFEGNRRQIGNLLPIVIYDANAHTLFGEVVTRHVGPELFTLSAPMQTA